MAKNLIVVNGKLPTVLGDGIRVESQSKTITPTAAGMTVYPDSNKLLTDVVVQGDANLAAENIKSGVTVFGVAGTHAGQKTEQSKTLNLGAAAPGSVLPDSGQVLSSVQVSLDSSVIKAENIKSGVQMLGITGSHSGGGITPSGTKRIVVNGTHDVANYANALVDVGGAPDLPSGYTRYEYIESSGTQWIDSGVLPTSSSMAEADFIISGSVSSSYAALVSAAQHMHLAHFYFTDSSTKLYTVTGWNGFGPGGIGYKLSLNTRYKMRFANNVNDFGGTSEKPYLMTGISYFCDNDAIANASAYFAASPYAPVNSYVIFARNNGGGGVSYQTSAKLYRLRMWCDGSLVRDFIPAMRNSDSKIGLYDNVNNVFYQNQGTGNFTGAVVQ